MRQSTYDTPTDSNLASLFHAIDGKQRGYVTVDDFQGALRKMGRASLSSHKSQELLRLLTGLRGATRGRITRTEFVEGLRGTKNTVFCRWMEVRCSVAPIPARSSASSHPTLSLSSWWPAGCVE